jgi:hypothetical protein
LYKSSTSSDGIDDSGTFEYDSIVGLQGTVKFNDQWSFTAQGLVREQTDGEFAPNIDWAYIKWQPLSSLSVRAGLTRPPTFMFSDSVFVGYANTWARPPIEVYGISPVYLLEGVDVVWNQQVVGPVALTVQAYGGNSELKQPNTTTGGEYKLDVKDWYGAAVSAQYGSFMGRVGYGTKQYDEELPSLIAMKTALTQVGYADLAKDIGLDGNKSPILNVGVQYDNGSQFVISEYAHRGTKSIAVAEVNGTYLTVGSRFGGFTPYATVARLQVESPRSNSAIRISPAMSPVLRATLTTLDTRVDGIAALVSDQESYSAGVRYEIPSFSVLRGAVLKAQVDRIEAKDGGKGFLGAAPVNFDGNVNLYSISFDMVF